MSLVGTSSEHPAAQIATGDASPRLDRTGFPPQAFLIGAQKAGTTTLAFLLDRHPAVTVAQPKETYFFTQHWERGIDWYRERFPDADGAVLLDATTDYSMAAPEGYALDQNERRDRFRSGVPQRIHSVSPDAKFIYLLRDPVARTYSSYWHLVRAGVEKLSFRDALASNVYYLSSSDYEYQARRFFEYFPPDRFQFLVFEEFVLDPGAAAAACCRFLGVPEIDFELPSDVRRNPSYTYRGVGRLVTDLVPNQKVLKKVTAAARAILPGAAFARLRSVATQKVPPIAPEDRKYLAAHFAPRVERLERLLGRPLDMWR